MVLSVRDVAFSYGGNRVLNSVSFQIEERDRVAVVGYNGCGKTTLLNIISGELIPDNGEIALASNAVTGLLRQDSGLDPQDTILEEMKSANNADQLLERMKRLERSMGNDPSLLDEYLEVTERYEAIDGYNLDYQIRRLLLGMGFPEDTWNKRVGVLSGGEKTRLSLAKLLLQNPDLLLLDEPTNHLDLETMDWLEDYLKEYHGAVLMVSHDRHFLDATCNKTVEIQNGKSKVYSCAFSEYVRRKQEDERIERIHYQQTLEEAEKLQDYVDRNLVRASTSNMAKSRRKQLSKMDLTAPEDSRHVDLKFCISSSGDPYKEVLILDELAVGVAGKVLCEGLSFTVRRGDRVAVIGKNGIGKTTLLRTICGKQRPMGGRCVIGGGVRIGIQEQNIFGITNENPLMYIWDRYPRMSQLEVRKLLALVGFRDESVFTESAGLSGGELARLNLARLSLEQPNFLIMDEPTNHLDIFSKQTLFEALEDYDGTMLIVSHDRWFIEQLNCKVLLMENGGARLFESYDDYKKWYQTPVQAVEETRQPTVQKSGGNQKDIRREKAQARQRKSELERLIETLENEEKELNHAIELPENASDSVALTELCTRLDEVRNELSGLVEEYLLNYADD